MPTKRRKVPPRRIGQDVPVWAQRLIEGELPVYDSPEHVDLVDWLYFDEPVAGLPPARSAEGWAIWTRAKEVTDADEEA